MRPVHLAIGGIAALTLLLIGMVGQGLYLDHQDARQAVRALLSRNLAVLAHDVDAVFADADLASASVANVSASGLAGTSGAADWQALLRRQLASHPRVIDLRMRDATGALVAQAGRQPLRTDDSAAIVLQQQLARGVDVEWRFIAPGASRPSGSVAVSRLLHDRNGAHVGFVVAETPCEAFAPLLGRAVDGRAAKAVLFDGTRHVVLGTSGAGTFLETYAGFEALGALPAWPKGVPQLIEGEADVVAARDLDQAPFGVALSVDRDSSLAAWRRQAVQRSALAAVVAVVAGFLGAVLLRADRASRRAATREAVLGWAVENSSSSVMIADAQARIEYANARASEITGFPPEELLGRNPRVFASGHTPPEVYREMWTALEAGRAWSGVLENRRRDGSVLWERTRITPVAGPGGAIEKFVAIKDDVTGEQLALLGLQQAAAVFEHSLEAMMVTDAEGRIRRVNAAFESTTGFDARDIVGRTATLLVSPEHSPGVFDRMREALRATGRWQGELWNRHRDGHVYVVHQSTCAIRGADGRTAEYVTMFSDISERKRSEEEMRLRAYYDRLTGLPNRALLLERATQALALSRRQGTRVGILFLDLDGLKKVNDTHGHAVGDQALVELGRRVRGVLRESDTVARFGGDEFVVLAPQVKAESDVAALGQSILDAMAAPFVAAGTTLPLRVSVGYAVSGPDERVEAVIQAADQAMYAAKREGGGRVRSVATAG